jgi:hypothetical protein
MEEAESPDRARFGASAAEFEWSVAGVKALRLCGLPERAAYGAARRSLRPGQWTGLVWPVQTSPLGPPSHLAIASDPSIAATLSLQTPAWEPSDECTSAGRALRPPPGALGVYYVERKYALTDKRTRTLWRLVDRLLGNPMWVSRAWLKGPKSKREAKSSAVGGTAVAPCMRMPGCCKSSTRVTATPVDATQPRLSLDSNMGQGSTVGWALYVDQSGAQLPPAPPPPLALRRASQPPRRRAAKPRTSLDPNKTQGRWTGCH